LRPLHEEVSDRLIWIVPIPVAEPPFEKSSA